jgi:hypothetical protein
MTKLTRIINNIIYLSNLTPYIESTLTSVGYDINSIQHDLLDLNDRLTNNSVILCEDLEELQSSVYFCEEDIKELKEIMS